ELTAFLAHINIRLGYAGVSSRTDGAGRFPPGTTIEIRWKTGQVWPATVEGDTASWRVEAETVLLVPDGTEFVIAVAYPNAATETTDDYPWILGHARYDIKECQMASTTAVKNSMANAWAALGNTYSLHTGDPGAGGTANEASGPSYNWQNTTWGTASNGTVVCSQITFLVPAGDYTHMCRSSGRT